MSKIRMALLKDCATIGIAWIDASGVGQAIRVNVPRRKQEMIKRAIAEGKHFPEPKARPTGPIGKSEGGILYKKPSLILPADAAEAQDSEESGPKIIV